MFSRIQSHIARKHHKCSLCGEAIEKGEQYTRTVVGGDSVDFCDDKYHSKVMNWLSVTAANLMQMIISNYGTS